jgi:hypothetical protein
MMKRFATSYPVSWSAKADDPVRRDISIQPLKPVITEYPAFAGYDGE